MQKEEQPLVWKGVGEEELPLEQELEELEPWELWEEEKLHGHGEAFSLSALKTL